MGSVVDKLSGSPVMTVGFAAALLLGIYLFTRDAFWWTDLSYRLPLVGKLARYSKDYSETKRGGWLNVEATLCRDYARHLTSLSKPQFTNDREYLRKAFDHGRRPMPP